MVHQAAKTAHKWTPSWFLTIIVLLLWFFVLHAPERIESLLFPVITLETLDVRVDSETGATIISGRLKKHRDCRLVEPEIFFNGVFGELWLYRRGQTRDLPAGDDLLWGPFAVSVSPERLNGATLRTTFSCHPLWNVTQDTQLGPLLPTEAQQSAR